MLSYNFLELFLSVRLESLYLTNKNMRSFIESAMHIAAVAMGLLLVTTVNAASLQECKGLERRDAAFAPNAFQWEVQSESHGLSGSSGFRIAVFGDSLTAARPFIDAVLDANGIRKTAALPSYIQAGIGVPGLALSLNAACAGGAWQIAYAHKENQPRAAYAKGFLRMHAQTPGDTLYLDFRFPQPSSRLKALNVLYEKEKPDDSLLLGIAVDGDEERLVSLRRSAGPLLQIRPDAPMSTLRLRLVSGQLTLHGFEPVYETPPAVVLDMFSVPGGMLRSVASLDPRYLPATGKPAYDLLLVQYGTNEGAVKAFDRQAYATYLRTHLRRLRQFYPEARCVLIGPPDRGAPDGSPQHALIHRQIALAQQQIAPEFHCASWDWQAAMGGPGTAARWAASNPPLMQPDLTHLTAKGYDLSGRLFAKAFPFDKSSSD